MSILIKSMKMPTRCYTCPCADLEFYDCNLMPGTRIEQHKRLDDCPLVPVPPHGRLIDADAFETAMFNDPYQDFVHILAQLPTIIPADHEEEEMK